MNTDPIADMLTIIINANMVSHQEVEMPSSKLKVELAKLLKSEGYIADYSESQKDGSAYKTLKIALKPVSSDSRPLSLCVLPLLPNQ